MVKEILQTMGRRVRVLREERRLTQLELAAAIRKRGVDCSNSLISSIETGRANPSLEVFVAIADELDVTLDYLATRTDRIESPRADTAYVSGAMDDERYQEQVKRLRAAIEQEQSAQTQLRAAAEAATQRGSRAERLAEIAASGPAMLTAEDTAVANAWLRRYVRVYVRENQVTEVRFL